MLYLPNFFLHFVMTKQRPPKILFIVLPLANQSTNSFFVFSCYVQFDKRELSTHFSEYHKNTTALTLYNIPQHSLCVECSIFQILL